MHKVQDIKKGEFVKRTNLNCFQYLTRKKAKLFNYYEYTELEIIEALKAISEFMNNDYIESSMEHTELKLHQLEENNLSYRFISLTNYSDFTVNFEIILN